MVGTTQQLQSHLVGVEVDRRSHVADENGRVQVTRHSDRYAEAAPGSRNLRSLAFAGDRPVGPESRRMAPSVRFVAFAAAAVAVALGTAKAAGPDSQPSIDVPAGWTQTHAENGDTTWKRDEQQLHVKVHAFTGTLDALVRIVRQGAASDPDSTAPKITDAEVRTCGGTQQARRITIDTGPGEKRVIADLTVTVDGTNYYEASYLRLAREPDRPEAHAAVMSLCIKRS
jgi:hypothetical protein